MDLKMSVYHLMAVLILASMGLSDDSRTERFDKAFQNFLNEKQYRGGAVAAMKDGRLLVARGYGVDRSGREVNGHTSFPVSSLAKSLTAAAVMKLVQDGRLNLDDKVFGENGLLYDVTSFNEERTDPRIYDITVDHLLRHTGGWDTEVGPLYDPIYNEIYLQRGLTVPNIAREMNTPAPLDPVELISYVMSQPLTFTPGTRVAYSNFGYVVLGRVIESVTPLDYIGHVKKSILHPCGMWKTKIYPYTHDKDRDDTSTYDPPMTDSLDPITVDSTLGWYSNVYDLMRFTRCLFDTDRILDDKHLELLLARPAGAPVQHDDVWDCAGFRTNTRNLVWQDADKHADDLILYHNLNPRGSRLDALQLNDDYVNDYDYGDDDEPRGRTADDLPDSWVVLLFDKKVDHIRHHTRELMAELGNAEDALLEMAAEENLFLYDLSELHRHPTWKKPPMSLRVPDFVVRYRVDEHHITAFVNALKDEGFTIHSLSTLTVDKHTTFLIVAQMVTSNNRVDSDFVFEHGMDYRNLLKKKLQLESSGYNMTLLHSYKSKTHYRQYSFAAVFRFEAFAPNMQMKYGTNHLPEPYQKLVQMYHEKEFYPLSQTVVYHAKEEYFSFIFVKRPGSKRVDFKHFYDLSPKKLTKVAGEQMLKEKAISYLNAYDVKGKTRFSAIFSNATYAPGTLEIEQPLHRASEITISNLNYRMVPKQMVPYMGDDGEIKVAAYYQEL